MHFSIVIPTHHRATKLEQCLRALGTQRAAPAFDVIIVFDGPEPEQENRTRELGDTLHLKMQVLTQAAAGPATARNRGARAAHGDRLLFLGDDVIPDESLLFEHARSAREHPEAAVLGYVPWARKLRVTPFMQFLAPERGPQFHFGMICDPNDCGYQFCFTANFALPTAVWEAEPFDEEFRDAAGEDTEWSWRMAQRGLRIVFNKQAVAWHDHAVTLGQFIERQRRAGRAAALIWRKHPELRDNPDMFPDPAPFFFSPKGDSLRDKWFTLRIALRHYLGLSPSRLDYSWITARPYIGALHDELDKLPEYRAGLSATNS
jgi:GT2 family glycosyltransferase